MNALQTPFRKPIIKLMIAIAIALWGLTSNHFSHAATFIVNIGIDGSVNGCTLRVALDIINTGTANVFRCPNRASDPLGENDTIRFNISTVSGIATPLIVNKCVKINPDGNRVAFRGTGDSRLMTIDNITCGAGQESDVQINNIGFSGGNATADQAGVVARFGGALFIDASNVKIKNSEFNNNNAADDGGAIFANQSQVTVDDSVITDNSSEFFGGAISILEGAGSAINNSKISGNQAGSSGGGIELFSTVLTINNSEISGNQADSEGGGVVATESALTINHTTVADNRADFLGGGISFNNVGSLSQFSCNYSTISGNDAETSGGGISFSTIDSVIINACIIAGNDSEGNAGEIHSSFDFSFEGASNLFGGSRNSSSTAFSGFTPRNIDIVATSDGNTPTPLASILLPLADNGGVTRTHALPEGSPVIDKITGPACTDLDPSTDQRGMSRPSGPACDIGAFELQQDTPPEDTPSFFVIPVGDGKSVLINL